MARTKKDNRKRRIGYVLGSLDRAMEHCLIIKAEFDESLALDPSDDGYLDALYKLAGDNTHAKLAFALQTALTLMLGAQSWMEQFAIRCYGKVPDKVERWTSTGEDWRKKHGKDQAKPGP